MRWFERGGFVPKGEDLIERPHFRAPSGLRHTIDVINKKLAKADEPEAA